jgi:hypothetical protein
MEAQFVEKLAAVTSCTPEGSLSREEALTVSLSVRPDGTVAATEGATTTLPDCGVAECFLNALGKRRSAGAPIEAGAKFVAVPVVLRPDASPRARKLYDPIFTTAKTTCEQGDRIAAGRMNPEVIQDIVRANFSEFRMCYERGLNDWPELEGRVQMRFVIATDGRVSKVTLDDNTLPNCSVAACVREAFEKLVFPAPQGGIVTVVYPIQLARAP